jgi:alpha-ribazole phosphatase
VVTLKKNRSDRVISAGYEVYRLWLCQRERALRGFYNLDFSTVFALNRAKDHNIGQQALELQMGKLFLIRHGQTELNARKCYCGSTDVALSQVGVSQAGMLAQRLAGEEVKNIFTSPLARSAQTAEIISTRHEFSPQIKEGLREIDFGDWEGLTFDQINSQYPQEIDKWFKHPDDFVFPGGESVQSFHQRVINSFAEIVSHPGPIVVVAHGATLKVAICYLCGWPMANFHSFSLSNAGLSIIDCLGASAIVKSLNDTSFLGTDCL